MSTQHPDNVNSPFFAENTELGGEDEIQEAVAEICALIDWGTLSDDEWPPYVDGYFPVEITNVSILTEVQATIKELLPSAGIDLSNIKVTLDTGKIYSSRR